MRRGTVAQVYSTTLHFCHFYIFLGNIELHFTINRENDSFYFLPVNMLTPIEEPVF